jgi:nucleotidyltransferase/DNA polymerase involved in DNA repair
MLLCDYFFFWLHECECRPQYFQEYSDKEKNVRECLCRVDDDYQDRLLACGAIIVAQVRVRVLEETQFTCSAGIAHNKVYNVSQ